MVKARKSKKADAVYAKKSRGPAENPFALAQPATASSKKLNPFEVHVNREKFQILGRTCKHDKGLPGVSRAKAVKRRKETLGEEFSQKHKTNQFKDRRIGRHLGSELTEEVMNARFMADQMAQLKQNKASRFNLNDDEVLTHRGQTLEEIQNFRDDRSDDEDSDNERLDAEFTETAHFGGDGEDAGKDRKTAIDDMIMQQKKRKLEIAKEKDELHDLTERLDSSYKDIIGLVGKMTKNEMKASKPPPDDYDKLMREMVFEPRGVVADKLVSVEEQAKKEKERLEKLENERLRRMRADDEEDTNVAKTQTHRSADDLDEGYFANGDEENGDDGCLAYNLDGELATNLNGKKNEENEEDDESEEGEAGLQDEEGEDEDEEDSDEEDEDEEESGSDNEGLSDLKVSDSEEGEAAEEERPTKNKNNTKVASSQSKDTQTKVNLPYTIELPSTYKEFHQLIAKHTPEDQGVIVERIIKCNHPKLDGVNREVVVKLFTFLLQYINELFADASQEDVALHFRILNAISPHLYDLVHLNGERMTANLLSVFKEKYADFQKHSKRYPGLETVIFLKLVANLYTTSDFRHPIVTPCYIFMQHILSRAQVKTRQDVAMGLLICTVCLEYGQLSKRFLPAVFNFLLGILYISIPKRAVEATEIVPPFESTGPLSKLLAVAGSDTGDDASKADGRMLSEDLVMTTCSVDFKIRSVNCALRLVTDAVSNLEDVVGSCYFAQPFVAILKRMQMKTYPDYVRQSYAEAEAVVQRVAEQKLTKLVPPAKKPKALRLLEPRIEIVYDDKRRPKLTKEKEEKVKLLHKVKRETKGAVREIRRDTEYLQKIRIRQQIQSDLERKEKVKRIYQEASMQQGELNELARAKKKKKF